LEDFNNIGMLKEKLSEIQRLYKNLILPQKILKSLD